MSDEDYLEQFQGQVFGNENDMIHKNPSRQVLLISEEEFRRDGSKFRDIVREAIDPETFRREYEGNWDVFQEGVENMKWNPKDHPKPPTLEGENLRKL